MGKECEMVSVLALAEALGVHVRVEYLDGRPLVPGGTLAQHAFGPTDADICLHFLYRPGHYDILYPKEQSPPPKDANNATVTGSTS